MVFVVVENVQIFLICCRIRCVLLLFVDDCGCKVVNKNRVQNVNGLCGISIR